MDDMAAVYRICPTDIVRVVDPLQQRVLTESAAFASAWGGAGDGPCYHVWGRLAPCELCISRQAVVTGRAQAKFRLVHDRVLLVMAIPLQWQNRLVVAEHLCPLTVGRSLPITDGWEQDLSAVLALAYRDCLTGVYSRHVLELCLQQAGPAQYPMTAVLIDLDDFKAYNDAHGHAVGDQVLSAFGAFLQRVFSREGAVFRFGGDEFIALLPRCTAQQAQALLTVFDTPCALPVAGRQVVVAAAAGCCQIDQPGITLSEVISQADRMLYHRKEARKRPTGAI